MCNIFNLNNQNDLVFRGNSEFTREPEYKTGRELKGTGKRYNEGKPRVELLPAHATLEAAKVFTFGAEKYGEHNWTKGMKWSNIIASLKRHILKIELGEDYDSESGLLHAAHVVANSMMLAEYYHIYPQGDDRIIYNKFDRIALDVDGVLANCEKGLKNEARKRGIEFSDEPQVYWSWNTELDNLFKEIMHDEQFWLNLEPMVDGRSLKFEPVAYVTHRPVPNEVTVKWLNKHGFPNVPVYTVNGSKVETLKELDVDVFVDDKVENVLECLNAGIFSMLMSRPYNEKYHHKFGHKVLKSLDDLM